jgi:branched-chain amino acid transport system ATP-binding protein
MSGMRDGATADAGDPVHLEVRDLRVQYDGIKAVHGVSFSVLRGEVLTLIGANGAGKSSILRAISGLVPYDGTIAFAGRDLRAVPAHRIVGLGMAHVPEGRGIFGNLTVRENLRLATWQRRDRGAIEEDLARVIRIFPRLGERLDQVSGTLSGGEQQMLAVGRALMTRASMLLLDEPSMGLSPRLVREIFAVIAEINRAGTTVLLVEQNANMALHIAARACVLETGLITLSGPARELLGDRRVKDAYLGA